MVSVNSLSDEPCFYLQNLPRLAEGLVCLYSTRCWPLFFIPLAVILPDGALSGTFHPNAGRHKDMTITADFSCRGLGARRPARPSAACRTAGLRTAGLWIAGLWIAGRRTAGRRITGSRNALSLRLFRLPEPESGVAQHPPIPQSPKGTSCGAGDFLRSGGLPAGRPPRRVPAGRIAWRASIPSPGFSAVIGASVCS